MCVCLCGQERELLVLVGVPGRDMNKQIWDDEAEHSIDFKQRKCEFPITGKVRAANCW